MSIYLPDDVHEALERFITEKHPGLNQTEAMTLILRKWLVHENYLPAELNRHAARRTERDQ